MYKYLIITEEQQVLGLIDEPTPDILKAVNIGGFTLINVIEMKEYYNNQWHDISSFKALPPLLILGTKN